MSQNHRKVEDVLDRTLPSASREQTESACSRVYNRLQTPGALDDVLEPELSVQQVRASGPIGWWWVPAMTAAAVLVAAMWMGLARDRGVYGILETGERLEAGEIVRSSQSAGSTFTLPDGSRVEMRAQTELLLEPTDDGVKIRLSKGGVIVNAAKQRAGHLYVQTKDVMVSVVGTVFLVNAEEEGSSVAVIEGEVRVQHGADVKELRKGEQVATSPLLGPLSMKEGISWSQNRVEHTALLQQPPNSPAAVRGGTITGVIRTAAGTPAVGVRVTAMRSDSTDSTLRAMSSLAQTDESGRYRLENVPAGTYYIAAGRVDFPTFFPGTIDITKGNLVSITSAATYAEIDFVIQDTSATLPSSGDLNLRLAGLIANVNAMAAQGDALAVVRSRANRSGAGLDWWNDINLLERLAATPEQKTRLHVLRDQHLALVFRVQTQAETEAAIAARERALREVLSPAQQTQLDAELSRQQNSTLSNRDRLNASAASLSQLLLNLEQVRTSVQMIATGAWWRDSALTERLKLTEVQKKAIEAIEAQYQASALQNNQTRAEREAVLSKMEAEILQILTPPQRDELKAELRTFERAVGDRLNRSSVRDAPGPTPPVPDRK